MWQIKFQLAPLLHWIRMPPTLFSEMPYCFLFGISHHVFWRGITIYGGNEKQCWISSYGRRLDGSHWFPKGLWQELVHYTSGMSDTVHCVRYIWYTWLPSSCDWLSLRRRILLTHSSSNTKVGPTHTFRRSEFLKLVVPSNSGFSHVSMSFGITYYIKFCSLLPCIIL
jgi:hypothetical protein